MRELELSGTESAQAALIHFEDGEVDVAVVRERLARLGFAWIRGLAPRHPAGTAVVVSSPLPIAGRALVEHLLGVRPLLAEVQHLRPVPGARSFAGSSVHTPLHTDSQDFLGVAPTVQVLVADRPASRGGETTLLDTHAVLADVARADPALHDALFELRRTIPFYFGEVVGPTIALKRGHLVVTHAPMEPKDAIGRAFLAFVMARPPVKVALVAGDVLVVDNHRMLHGRTAFEDPARRLIRTLAWMPQPLAHHEALRARATRVAAPQDLAVAEVPPALRAILDLLAGDSPASTASRANVPEATLYQWRNTALEAAWRALAR